MENDGILGWLLAGVGTVIATLSGLVAKFYKNERDGYIQREIDLKTEIGTLTIRVDDCEKDRADLRVKVAVTQQKISDVEQRCDALEERISESKETAETRERNR